MRFSISQLSQLLEKNEFHKIFQRVRVLIRY
jgi:hypothetical protein